MFDTSCIGSMVEGLKTLSITSSLSTGSTFWLIQSSSGQLSAFGDFKISFEGEVDSTFLSTGWLTLECYNSSLLGASF